MGRAGLDGYDFLKFRFSKKVLSDDLLDKEKTTLQTKELITLENLNKDSVVVDIGSNWGLVIDALQEINCKIYAFEPHPLFFEKLQKKYSNNENVILSDNAVWCNTEKRKFYFKKSFDRMNGGATLMPRKTNIHNPDLNKEVQCIDIIELLMSIGTDVDVLKMDAEGAEYEILQRLISHDVYKKVKSIYFEDHSRKFVDHAWHSKKQKILDECRSKKIALNWW